jgi:hypothetical protein
VLPLEVSVLPGHVCSIVDCTTWMSVLLYSIGWERTVVSFLQQPACAISGILCATLTCLFHSRQCYLDMSVLKQTALPGCLFYSTVLGGNNRSVFSTAACMSYSWMCLLYSRLCHLDMSLLQKTVPPGCVCSTGDCATCMCVFYRRLCRLDVSVLYTGDCATWKSLFYRRLWYLDVSLIKQTVLPLGLDVSVHAFAVPGGVWPTATCSTWTCTCLQEPVQHLYMSVHKSYVLYLELSTWPKTISTHAEHSVKQFIWMPSMQ